MFHDILRYTTRRGAILFREVDRHIHYIQVLPVHFSKGDRRGASKFKKLSTDSFFYFLYLSFFPFYYYYYNFYFWGANKIMMF